MGCSVRLSMPISSPTHTHTRPTLFPQIHKFRSRVLEGFSFSSMADSSPSSMATEKQLRLQSSPSGLVLLNRHIPSGIISDIISRLPLEDIIRCTSVSTDFYQIIKNLRSNPMNNTKSQVLNILLSKTGDWSFGYVGVNENLHMISSNSKRNDGKNKHLEIPHQNELTGRVISSCNGLLCLAYSMGSPYAIYNPITNEIMKLPELELHPECDKKFAIRSGFGYDSINNKYKVVVAYDYKCYVDDDGGFLLKATGDIITLSESSWRRLEFPEGKGRFDTYQPVVFINGSFHWLNGRQHHWEYSNKNAYQLDGILTLDISTEKFNVIKYSASIDLDVSRVQVFNMGSSLALVGQKLGDDSDEDDSSDDDNSKPPPTKISVWKIWKILGVETPSTKISIWKMWKWLVGHAQGRCLYQCITLNVDHMTMKYLEPVGALGNDKFLFKASKYIPKSKSNHLILYDTENDKGSVLEVPAEVPAVYDATIFQPSLVLPTSLGMYSH